VGDSDGAHDGQAESVSVVVTETLAVDALKRLEEAVDLIGRHHPVRCCVR